MLSFKVLKRNLRLVLLVVSIAGAVVALMSLLIPEWYYWDGTNFNFFGYSVSHIAHCQQCSGYDPHVENGYWTYDWDSWSDAILLFFLIGVAFQVVGSILMLKRILGGRLVLFLSTFPFGMLVYLCGLTSSLALGSTIFVAALLVVIILNLLTLFTTRPKPQLQIQPQPNFS